MKDKLGIVILNYNTYEKTIDCVNSILRQNLECEFSIYIIDNNSKNNSYEFLLSKFGKHKNIKIKKNLENLGYACGNNVGINDALSDECQFILISNNDIIFEKKSIMHMVNDLKKNNIQAVGPKILNDKKEFQKDSYRNRLGIKEKFFVTTPLRIFDFWNINNEYYYSKKNNNESFNIFCLSGSCMMFDKEVFNIIGLLDENTFLYEEEPILFEKFNKKGFVARYSSLAEVIHLHGATTKNNRAFAFIEFVKSEKYYCKNYINMQPKIYSILIFIRYIQYIFRMFQDKSFVQNYSQFKKIAYGKDSVC